MHEIYEENIYPEVVYYHESFYAEDIHNDFAVVIKDNYLKGLLPILLLFELLATYLLIILKRNQLVILAFYFNKRNKFGQI